VSVTDSTGLSPWVVFIFVRCLGVVLVGGIRVFCVVAAPVLFAGMFAGRGRGCRVFLGCLVCLCHLGLSLACGLPLGARLLLRIVGRCDCRALGLVAGVCCLHGRCLPMPSISSLCCHSR